MKESLTHHHKKTYRRFFVTAIFIAMVIVVLWTIWGNSAPMVHMETLKFHNLPSNFNGYKIAQVSDLHNAEFGEKNETLLQLLSDAQPDIIVITGDIIDANHTDTEIAIKFVNEAVKIAPVYFVTGNHEAAISNYDIFESELGKCGVNILHNEKMDIEVNGESIQLAGVDDPAFMKTDWFDKTEEMAMKDVLEKLITPSDDFTILLSHRPELFEVYAGYQMELVFSGHAHGGQFRLPFIGGIIAPNQGLFPKYDAGIYSADDTSMVVSRGLGNSIIPIRFNNRPEVIVITLKKGGLKNAYAV